MRYWLPGLSRNLHSQFLPRFIVDAHIYFGFIVNVHQKTTFENIRGELISDWGNWMRDFIDLIYNHRSILQAFSFTDCEQNERRLHISIISIGKTFFHRATHPPSAFRGKGEGTLRPHFATLHIRKHIKLNRRKAYYLYCVRYPISKRPSRPRD